MINLRISIDRPETQVMIPMYLLYPVFSKSVFRYCKVSFYPPNIDIVLFSRKYTDIDIDAQYQEIYTDILVLSVKHLKKNLLIIQMLKNVF